MISVIGIGNGASAIAQKFSGTPQYEVYALNDKVLKNSKYKFRLKKYDVPEDYENNTPDLTKFFANIRETVQVFIVGSSYSSNYALGILEQLKEKEIEIFYIQPDVELLTGIPKLVEATVFGVLQEYARSGLFKSITLISNLNLEQIVGEISIKNYFDSLNTSIYSTIHYINFFNHADPEIGNVARPAPINRIRTIGFLNMKDIKEKWLFDLDIERELCYYLCINKKKLETESGLHKKIVDMLKEKPKNAFRKISYAIYETDHKQDFGFCVAHTNAIQQQKDLDKLS
jgi:hypothetical protein